ncbi:hypothetical protein [Polystyrenella longa]|uniref:hypothetical protein n=1 Tax=Polystyrenella longa TaxID=2528007 RepID=UPI0011AAC3E3|nr:hypothetical protein [Polystyrenella longa]
MRNIFDQYQQPENRMTHALATVLQLEPSLLRPFLTWLGVDEVPRAKSLRITQQQVRRGQEKRRC